MKKILKILMTIVLCAILIFVGYLIYLLISYERIPDCTEPDIITNGDVHSAVDTGSEYRYTLTSWNVGFGAYTSDYSFFMDGGTESRGFSKEAVLTNTEAIADKLESFHSDFYLVQEVDTDSTRSYHIDQKQIFTDKLTSKASTYGINYDSAYLLYPFLKPHGKSKAGILTLSDYAITSSVRRQLPIEEGLAKFIDLDRCYTINRIPASDGKEMILINVHLSAYTKDPQVANNQLEMLYDDITSEYEKGNYIICGGDFNKDLLGDSSAIFGIAGKGESWTQSYPFDSLPDAFSIVAPFDKDNPVPSCRNADSPWDKETSFQLTIDGFLVSDNVKVYRADVIDTDFAYSDHNPVYMEFSLQ